MLLSRLLCGSGCCNAAKLKDGKVQAAFDGAAHVAYTDFVQHVAEKDCRNACLGSSQLFVSMPYHLLRPTCRDKGSGRRGGEGHDPASVMNLFGWEMPCRKTLA